MIAIRECTLGSPKCECVNTLQSILSQRKIHSKVMNNTIYVNEQQLHEVHGLPEEIKMIFPLNKLVN